MTRTERALLCAASFIALGAGAPAWAQTSAAAPAKDAPATTGDIVVTGVRASLRDAIAQKRISTAIVETISSKDIGVLPDVTIADELSRLPGINATRDRGNDSQAAVRGLGPRLVLGLVNGREVASSEPDRNVRWEIYPSEDVTGVTVYKSQSADLIAGGVAATIDLHTLRPLDYSGPKLVVRLGPLYNDGGATIPGYSPWGLRGSAEYVAKINDDFAVSLGGNYQKQQNGYVSFQGWGYNTPYTGSPPTLNGVVTNTPWGAQTEVDGLTETRSSLSGAAQWKPTNNLEVNFDVLYSDVSIDENQEQAWYGRSGSWGDWAGDNANGGDPYNSGNFTVINGDVVSATIPFGSVTNVIAHYTEDKKLLATGLNGVWTNSDWKMRGDLSYSDAQRTNRWQAIETEAYPGSTTFNTRAGAAPSVVTSGNPADPTAQYAQSYLSDESDGPVYLNDALGALQVDLSRSLHGEVLTSFDFGARYSDRIKSQNYYRWFESPTSAAIPSSMLSEFQVKGLNVPDVLNGNFNQIANYVVGGYQQPANAFLPANYWRVHEQDTEAYAKVNFRHDVGGLPLSGNAGVRVVSVNTTSTGFQQLNGSSTYTSDSEGNSYTDVLPSVNLNLGLTDDSKLRFGAARVISRPPLDELRAGRSLYNTSLPFTGTAGNPKLNPFLASQVDLSYEWYFHPESLFAVAAYYKNVDSNVGYKTDNVTINGSNYLVTGPFNGKGGGMEGLEFTLQTPFYFIPHMEHFGLYSNLALASSDIKEFSPVNNPLPMVGLANTTADVSLWYSQFGVDARLDYKYHSPFTVIYGWDASQLTRLESEGVLGASVSYQITHNLSVRFQANNLTDQVSRYYWNNDPQQLARYDRYGRSYLMDFTLKY
ncbi:MAG TPA: TonB-dependent receptor [Caulobacteraceae bacterium]|jgi:TonB-dependent receptor